MAMNESALFADENGDIGCRCLSVDLDFAKPAR